MDLNSIDGPAEFLGGTDGQDRARSCADILRAVAHFDRSVGVDAAEHGIAAPAAIEPTRYGHADSP